VLASGPHIVASGPLSAKFFPWLKSLVMPLVCCLNKQLSKQFMLFFCSA